MFLQGYGKFSTLNSDEVDAIPILIKLRILSNVVYFAGKAISKEDTFDMLATKVVAYAKRLRLLRPIEERFKSILNKYLLK